VPPMPTRRARIWIRGVWRFFAVQWFDLRVQGVHHIPESGPAILIGNHPTFFDPYFVSWGLTKRWITWLAWDEAFDWPVIGPLITTLGAVPINLERADTTSLRTSYAVLGAGRLLGVFFEGKRTLEGNFKINDPLPGAARIALRSGVPLVPFSISGARKAWPYSAKGPSRGRVVVRFHSPIYPQSVLPGERPRRRAEVLTQRIADVVRADLPADGRASVRPS
jgi:1-acyl-sn-glycerol-3-phosphate acyltransferase